MGYLTLDTNERSNYQARELKSVYINASGRYIQLRLHECYPNKFNLFNQVGLVAINLLGSGSSSSNNNSLPSSSTIQNSSGSHPRNPQPDRSRGPLGSNDLSIDLNFDQDTALKLRQIAEAKQRAVQNEDYSTAKQLKVAENELKALGGKLAQLDVSKHEAVDAEDYDRAADLKGEMDDLRVQIEQHIRDINLDQLIPKEMQTIRNSSPRYPYPDSQQQQQQQQQPPPMKHQQENVPQKVSSNPQTNINPSTPMSSLNNSGPTYGNDEVTVGSGGGGNQNLPPEHVEEMKSPGVSSRPDHPLGGVENCGDLPEPDPLPAKVEISDIQPMLDVFGEYLVRCLYSKVWGLREAFFKKVILMLPTLSFPSATEGVCLSLTKGFADKIAQVIFSSVSLLQDLLHQYSSDPSTSASSLVTFLDPVLSSIILRLGDGQARTRSAATSALQDICSSPTIGPAPVSAHCCQPLPGNQKSNWRAIAARMDILSHIAEKYGAGRSSGLHVESAMNFVKVSQSIFYKTKQAYIPFIKNRQRIRLLIAMGR